MISANLDRAPIRAVTYATEQERAFGLSRAVLLALREWLTATEVVELARRLPCAMVPVLFHDWYPQSVAPPRPTRAEFVARVAVHMGQSSVAEYEIAEALRDLAEYLPARLFASPKQAHHAILAGGQS
jgi:uncharacterized protein (DUF2267 family)